MRGHWRFRRRATGDLVGETAFAVGDDHSRNALHQDAVLVRDLLGATNENASRPIEHVRLYAAGNQSR